MRKSFQANPVSLLLALYICLFSLEVFAAEEEKWQGYVEFLGKPGTERSLGQADLFIPLIQNDSSLVFFNLRGQADDRSNEEYNLGLGYRQLYDQWIIGGYGYFDHRSTQNNNSFYQGTIGVEALSEQWDFRANGYIPESTEKRVNALSGTTILNTANVVQAGANISVNLSTLQTTTLVKERALPGFDFEVGYKLPVFEDTRIYVGGFHFDAGGFKDVTGPRGRLEMRFHGLPKLGKDSRLMLGIEVTHDSVRDTQAFGLVQLQIPFDVFGSQNTNSRPRLTSLEQRMVEPVVRDVDIVSGTNSTSSTVVTDSQNVNALNPDTGNAINNVTTLTAADSNAVHTAVAAAGADSLVILDGSGGTINNASSVILQNGQILAGAGQPLVLQYNDPNGGVKMVSYTPSGSTPTLNNTTTINNAIVMESNSTVSGMNITGGLIGVLGSSKTNIRIENTSATSTDQNGFAFVNSTGSLSNVKSTNAGAGGVSGNGFLFNGGTYTADQLTVQNAFSRGIQIQSANVTLTNSTINITGSDGVLAAVTSNLTMNNTSISNIGSNAAIFANSTLSGSGNTITAPVAGAACFNAGGNTGSIAFDDILGGGPGTCP